MKKPLPGTVRVGTRGSDLAIRQTETIIALMGEKFPGTRFEIVRIVTHGDRFQEKPIAEMGAEVDKGIFNTALEDAVLGGEVDFSTCSFKDVQSDLRPSLTAVSVAVRADHRDVLVSRHGVPLAELPPDSVLATSSPRRISQLMAFRPDFRFVPLRGNVTTRVERESLRYDGIILAAAGLLRLGLEHRISQWIPEPVLLPAPAQGAMGCEFVAANAPVAELVRSIQHPETEVCARAEKEMLVRLSGGCFAPIGVLARVTGGRFSLECRIASLDGTRVVEERKTGAPVRVHEMPAQAKEMIETMAGRIAENGGLEIVEQVRAQLESGGKS